MLYHITVNDNKKNNLCKSIFEVIFIPSYCEWFFLSLLFSFLLWMCGGMYCKNDHRIDLSSNRLSLIHSYRPEHCNEYEDHRLQSNIKQNKITNNNNNNNLLTLMLFQTFMTSEKHWMCVPEERNSSQLQFRNILFNWRSKLLIQIIRSFSWLHLQVYPDIMAVHLLWTSCNKCVSNNILFKSWILN